MKRDVGFKCGREENPWNHNHNSQDGSPDQTCRVNYGPSLDPISLKYNASIFLDLLNCAVCAGKRSAISSRL